MGERPRKAREEGSSKSKLKGERKIRKREQRCLDDHGVFNRTTMKCAPCDPCGDGKGRDFSHPASLARDDQDGSHVCPPCHECPRGTYNNEKYAVTCQRCVVNCKSRNRIIAEPCSRLGDTVCGSCEKGYQDDYGNTDMPCEKIPRSTTKTPTPRVTAAPLNNSTQLFVQDPGKVDHVYRVGASKQVASQQMPAFQNAETIIIASCLASVFVIIAVLVFLGLFWHLRKRRSSSAHVEPMAEQGLISANPSSASLSHDHDIDVDARPETPPETPAERLSSYERQFSGDDQFYLHEDSPPAQPHGELSGHSEFNSQGPRPELPGADTGHHPVVNSAGQRDVPGVPRLFDGSTGLFNSSCVQEQSQAVITSNPEPVPGVHGVYPPIGSVPNTRGTTPGHSRSYTALPAASHNSPTRQICQCSPDKCHLCSGGPLLNTCAQRHIKRDSPKLRVVAINVCHTPIDLYHNLDIPEAHIYQIDDDRNRVPEKISESDNILNILKKWAEVKNKDATLAVLCQALCDSRFHHITDKIYVQQTP